MKTAETHVDGLTLVAAARGALASSSARRLFQHCLVCDDCRAELEALRQLRRAFGLAAPAPRPPASLVPAPGTLQ